MEKRRTYIDILKIVSIFMVLYVHTADKAMYVWLSAEGFTHWFSLCVNQFATAGPSVFFLISGALLLGRCESLKDVLKHRVFRYGVLLFLFGMLQQIILGIHYNNLSNLTFVDMLKTVYSTDVITQYWFLYWYLAFLIILPFLRMIAKAMDKSSGTYLLALLIIAEVVLVIVEKAVNFDRINIMLPILERIVVLPLLGYCIENVFAELLERKIVAASVVLFGVLCLAINVIYADYTYNNWGYSSYIDGCVYFVAVGLYVLMRTLFGGKEFKPSAVKALSAAGGGTMLVFLLEPEVRFITEPVYDFLAPYITWFPAAVIWLLCAMAIGIAVSLVLKLIPGIKKLF